MNPIRQPFFGMGPGPNPGFGFPMLSKMTNNQDAKSKASRVFIGNLNTGQVNAQQILRIFQNYGNVTGVSLMKGYGFVQFDCEVHARKAVQQEYGKVLANQPMDLRIANDPNPNRPKGFKRVQSASFGYQGWGEDPNNRPYVDPASLPVQPAASNQDSPQNKKMRFQNMTNVGSAKISGDEPSSWMCAFCQSESVSPWELMKHASLAHQTQIYIANPEYEGNK